MLQIVHKNLKIIFFLQFLRIRDTYFPDQFPMVGLGMSSKGNLESQQANTMSMFLGKYFSIS